MHGKDTPGCCVCAEKLLVQMDAGLYFFINQGCLTVDNMNDKEEMDIVDVSGSFQRNAKPCDSVISMNNNNNNSNNNNNNNIVIVMIFISSAALSKIRRAAGTCHSV